MLIKCLPVGHLMTNCYIVTDETTLECAVIDPGDESNTILYYLEDNHLTCRAILLTHGHYDHTGAVYAVHEETGAPVYMNALVAYTPVSIPETNTFTDEALLCAGKLEPGGLLERVKEARTVILVSPRLELLRRIASGDDGDPLSHLLVRAILWQKDVRVYLDYEPPRFRRNTFLADTAEAIDTLRQMAVTVCPYFAVAPQEPEGTDLVTEADVLDAAKTESKTIRCRSGAIITPAARDALAATDVILRYEGETTHAAS